ncbi:MAG: putative integral rane protein [Naasia sp.]|uniref:YihY/virulence factor BrkB family protein n=1 Tax=Naasia sp. TaxID=2546198 RepID=UPI00262B8E4E|nr:YihY/virulence factor BrkB family protein [Naasia sp.]MCU1569890.1 putative integral rane protein [Naasia sp.]
MAKDADALAVRDNEAVLTAASAKATSAPPLTGIAALIDKLMRTRPMRVFQHYNADGGPLMAAGMSYNAVFATFAALWVTFSVAGFIISGNELLKQGLLNGINSAVPGLVSKDGVIDPNDLLSASTLSWAGAIALVGLLLTALGFLASMRDAIRRIFALPGDTTFFLLQKARDLGLALGFGVLILVSAGLSFISNATLGAILNILGIDEKSIFAAVLLKIASYLLVFLVDLVTVAGAYRILSAVEIPLRRLLVGAAIGAAGIGILKAAFGLGLIGGVGNNPLLTGFAVIFGLLIFFNFFCQVLLVAASWIAVGMADAGIDARALGPMQVELDDAVRLEEARRLVADANHRKAEEEYRAARGIRKWRLRRRIAQDARKEARRRQAVPTTDEFAAAEGTQESGS